MPDQVLVAANSLSAAPKRQQASGPDPDGQPLPRLYALSMPVPDVTAEAILQATTHDQRFYWAAPQQGAVPAETLAGSGVAAELGTEPLLDSLDGRAGERFAAIREQVTRLFASSTHQLLMGSGELVAAPADHLARPRLIGGFSFSPEFVPDNTWSVFRPAYFVLPHFQFAEAEGTRWLTINAVLTEGDSDPEPEPGLIEALQTGHGIFRRQTKSLSDLVAGRVSARPAPEVRYPMSFDQWARMIDEAHHAMTVGALDKVVLSRVAELRGRHPVDPVDTLRRLAGDYANSYRFLLEPARDRFFLAATPELLVALRHGVVQSMALAGSVRRGQTAEEDAALAARLRASTKDRHEHQLVVDAMRDRLGGCCDPLIMAKQPTVLQLHNIQHLLTPIQGTVRDRINTDILTLIEQLHPTPALGGVPVGEALAFLTHAEPVPRGWYAAPVGWLDHQFDGAFAVAIRSAVCQYERAWLYAGAGIVPASDARREWDETELKFKPMLNAIAVEA